MLTVDEYMALRRLISSERESSGTELATTELKQKPKKRKTAYARKYSKAFKTVSKRYKNKNGTWKKGGFKLAVRAAHKAVKK